MPARRDYARAWRDTWVTLAQVPIAGVLAVDYFYQQWVERSATYLSQVSARLALARPVVSGADAVPDNVMADVLSEDLVEATRMLVRGLVTLPGETGEFFTRRVETMLNEVLRRIQPDAATDAGTYVVNELEKLNRTLAGLREVAAGEVARERLAEPAGRAPRADDHDAEALMKLLADLKRTAEPPARRRGQPPAEREALPREKMLLVVGAVVGAALKHFPPRIQQAPDVDAARRTVERARLRLALQDAQRRLDEVRADLRKERQGDVRPRARRELGRPRRTGR